MAEAGGRLIPMSDRVDAALAGEAARIRSEIRWHAVLAVPLLLLSFLLGNVLLLMLNYALWSFFDVRFYSARSWSFAAAQLGLAAAFALDAWRHPREEWRTPTFHLAGGGTSSWRFGDPAMEHRKGIFSGMPAMANLGDPHNWSEAIGSKAGATANLVLAGPRALRACWDLRAQLRELKRPDLRRSAREALEIVAQRGALTDEEAQRLLEERPVLAPGFHLCRSLRLIVRRRIQGESEFRLVPSEPCPDGESG